MYRFLPAFFLLSLAFPTQAQVMPPPNSPVLTMQQIADLHTALEVLKNGSIDQCTPSKDGKAPDRPCPYHVGMPLLRAMAHNLSVLAEPNAEYQTVFTRVRDDVFTALPIDPELTKVAPGETDAVAIHKTMAIRVIQNQREIQFSAKMKDTQVEKRKVPIALIKGDDLNVGDPPEHNRLTMLIEALSPMIIEDSIAATDSK